MTVKLHQKSRRRWLSVAGVCVLASALAVPGAVAAGTEGVSASDALPGTDVLVPPPGPDDDRPFGAVINRRIPANPVLDPKSRSISGYLSADGEAIANLYDYGTPIYTAIAATGERAVDCVRRWGPCDLEQDPVPIPRGAEPNPGSDAAMVVVHEDTGDVYEFWRAKQVDPDEWRTQWGEIVNVAGSPGNGSTGSGISRLAGIIRTSEIDAGRIRHALVVATDNACQTGYRRPATKTDGASSRPDCIEEGSRIQIDPSIDLSTLDLSPGERAVAVAMQQYGAYVIDNAAARLAVMFERPTDGFDPYDAAGLSWDYYAMTDIPWEGLRVLESWDGS